MINVCCVQFGGIENYGGATQMLSWLACTLNLENDINCNLIIYYPCPKVEEYLHGKCDVVVLNKQENGRRSLKSELASLIKLNDAIRRTCPDIIVSFGDHAFYPLLVLRPIRRYSLIISERGDPYSKRNWKDSLRRFLYRFANAMVFQTTSAADYFKTAKMKKAVIPNPKKCNFDYSWVKPVDNTFVYCSRIDFVQKRIDLLIEAFNYLNGEEVYLEIYGDGNPGDMKRLNKLVRSSHNRGRIKICGAVKDPRDAFRRGIALILPSDFEGIPNIVIEAMDFGIPVICTDCSPGGGDLLLEGGKNGYLVPRGSSRALCEAMINVIRDPCVAKRKANRAKHSLIRFSATDIGQKWSSFVREVAANHR